VLGMRHREKENLTDFISKKRDMFLVQMSLDTKKSEIQKCASACCSLWCLFRVCAKQS